MMHAYKLKDRSIPWWAAWGAPLVGVPAIVALLALVAPGTPEAGEVDEVDFAVEQLQTDASEPPVAQPKRSI